jgi:hypothetical protein
LTSIPASSVGILTEANGNKIIRLSPPDSLTWMIWTTRTDQVWNMFSPHPPKASWWFVLHGQLVDGRGVELFKNGGSSIRLYTPFISQMSSTLTVSASLHG